MTVALNMSPMQTFFQARFPHYLLLKFLLLLHDVKYVSFLLRLSLELLRCSQFRSMLLSASLCRTAQENAIMNYLEAMKILSYILSYWGQFKLKTYFFQSSDISFKLRIFLITDEIMDIF